jgi:hypothetical protein
MWVFVSPVKHKKNKHQITHSHSTVHIWVYRDAMQPNKFRYAQWNVSVLCGVCFSCVWQEKRKPTEISIRPKIMHPPIFSHIILNWEFFTPHNIFGRMCDERRALKRTVSQRGTQEMVPVAWMAQYNRTVCETVGVWWTKFWSTIQPHPVWHKMQCSVAQIKYRYNRKNNN